jgi:hypothetical protein
MQSPAISSSSIKFPWFWVVLIVLLLFAIGWSLFAYNDTFQLWVALAATTTFILAGTSRVCALAGFNIWAGTFAFTFGAVFILVGVLLAAGALGWAIALACVWAFGFTLDLALAKIVSVMDCMGLSQTLIFWILTTLFLASVALGLTTRSILPG